MKKILLVLLICVVWIGLNWGLSSRPSLAATMSGPPEGGIMITEANMNGMRYESGGVGLEERAAMERTATDYNLRLILATTSGLYLANVPVQIKGTDGKVLLSERSNGPWVFVKVPPGQYEITASYHNNQRVRKAEAGKGSKVIMLHWKP